MKLSVQYAKELNYLLTIALDKRLMIVKELFMKHLDILNRVKEAEANADANGFSCLARAFSELETKIRRATSASEPSDGKYSQAVTAERV